ncbi:hypothetical protein HETIRDRAFT_417853 [Heterobasidion irregulare TC 32-1]|uniref:FAD-dependent oxidoreductase 2 FAD-binding domain-containing protein n=1 Tax=Heterobasidion irregulare (strain TC 32-1) TaxID=747525 RepID=W4K7M8_HETIT|nr:uncharacterized protein HETIRDRAFT_417853 [Heterobasidion irregulare TC 32-1]ETW81783.1 hypothetical protein HETIRDRAFT_417853 [Heterobasidion irregulare TC 32-1]
MSPITFDCIVIGSGNAGCCAALSAVEHGCKRVVVIDKCPEEWAGGNGYFTAGAFRTVHGGLSDLLSVVPGVSPELALRTDIDPYSEEDFANDIVRISDGKSDMQLVKAVVDGSRDAITWLAKFGIPFTLSFNRQAYEVNGRQKFWGGMALSTDDGGKGLIRAHQTALRNAGVESWFETPALKLLIEDSIVKGVEVERSGEKQILKSKAVILASGGYESSAQLRAKHLGHGWDNARVRGTPYNTGDGIFMAKAVGAKLSGDWQGCHSTCWDANASPDAGDRVLSNQFTKSGYPLGLMINSLGRRFVNEGEDLRNFTYAKFGKEILRQPGGYAFQVWDSQVTNWLRKEEYSDGIVEKIWADSLEELAAKLEVKGLEDVQSFVHTVRSYNASVTAFRSLHAVPEWNPAAKDGLSTKDLPLPKSNWALTIDKAPFLAVKVACGITFTFGGVAIDSTTAGVLDDTGKEIEGLFCTGEMVGGLWYGNYPGGSGLTAGAVFGRKAGRAAAELVKRV